MPTNPAVPRAFEDYVVGQSWELGSEAVSAEAIVEFARRYDPQAFHVDPEAAKHSIFGGLVASGLHTFTTSMRLVVERFSTRTASLGSPGMDELRWPCPVRPGDVLSVRLTIVEAKPSRTKPDRGIATALIETLNQHGQLVMSLRMPFFVRRR